MVQPACLPCVGDGGQLCSPRIGIVRAHGRRCRVDVEGRSTVRYQAGHNIPAFGVDLTELKVNLTKMRIYRVDDPALGVLANNDLVRHQFFEEACETSVRRVKCTELVE